MADLKDTIIHGTLEVTEESSGAYGVVRQAEFDAALAAFASAYAHAPVTRQDSTSLALTLVGQLLSGAVRLAPAGGLEAVTDGLRIVYGTGDGEAARGSHSHPLADESAYGFMSASAYAKLAGLAEGATANQTDAYLLQREHHTGAQTSDTISDWAAAVVAYALALSGGTLDGRLSWGSSGQLGLPTLTTEAEGDIELPALWLNSETGDLRFYDGVEAKTVGEAVGDTVDFSEVYGDITISPAGRATLEDGVFQLQHFADWQPETFLGPPAASMGPPEFYSQYDFVTALGLQAGATANQTDAFLRDRANHTGQQTASTISDFAERVGEITLGPYGGSLAGPLTFTGAETYFQLPRLTESEIEALEFVAADKGVLVYNITQNRAELVRPDGRVAVAVAGEGGDFLLRDGTVASTGRRQQFKGLQFTSPAEFTLSSYAVSPTQSLFRLDTEGNVAADTLANAYGLTAGDVVVFFPENIARGFTIVHGAGNILCDGGEDIACEAGSYALLFGAYDHNGKLRVGRFGGTSSGGGSGVTWPVVDTTQLVKDGTDPTKRVRLDAGSVTTGATAVIQAAPGEARIRSVLSYTFADGAWALGTVHLDMLPADFQCENIFVYSPSASSTGSTPAVAFKVGGTSVATISMGTTGYGSTKRGETAYTGTISKGTVIDMEITDTGAASVGVAASGGVIHVVGFWKAVSP